MSKDNYTKSIYTSSNFTLTVNGERVEASTNPSPKYFDNAEIKFNVVLQENVHSILITMEFVEEDGARELYNIIEEYNQRVRDAMLVPVEMLGDEPKEIHYCQYNDCGWCYYKGEGNSNDNNSQCNKPQQCEVNINGE